MNNDSRSTAAEAGMASVEPAEGGSQTTRRRLPLIGAAALLAVGLLFALQGPMAIDPAALGSRAGSALLLLIEQGLLVGAWLAAAAGWGWGLRRLTARGGLAWPLGASGQLVAGAGLMCLAGWLVAWAGAANAAGVWAVGIVGWALTVWQLYRVDIGSVLHPRNWPRPPWPLALAAIAVGLLIGCTTLAPLGVWVSEQMGYEALLHHLQAPREWAEHGAMVPLEHNVYSYLPNLFEIGYMQLGLLRGSMLVSAYGAQLLHAAMALLTAGLIGGAVMRLGGGRLAGAVAAGAYLVTPWTLVTGSLAYADQAAMALGAAGLSLALWRPGSSGTAIEAEEAESPVSGGCGTVCHGLLIGLLVGLGVLCELSTVCMIALPIAVVILLHGPEGWGRRLARLGGFAAAVSAVAGLWMLRNGLWTGNPVFPYFGAWLGTGHWSGEQAARWSAAHLAEGGPLRGLGALWSGVLADERFGYAVLPAALVGAVFGWLDGRWRRYVGLLLAMMAVQAAVWVLLMPRDGQLAMGLLLPATLLIGLAVATAPYHEMGRFAATAAALVVLAAGIWVDATMYLNQSSPPLFVDAIHEMTEYDPSVPSPHGTNVYNFVNTLLPPESRVYTEGLVAPFYILDQERLDYHTRWDTSPIGRAMSEGGAEGAVRWLRERGYDFVVVDWGRLDEWMRREDNGYDPNVRPQALADLGNRLLLVTRTRNPRQPPQSIYRVPGPEDEPGAPG